MKLRLKHKGKLVREVEIPNKLHLEIQQNNKAKVFKSKKVYNRKRKHKENYEDI